MGSFVLVGCNPDQSTQLKTNNWPLKTLELKNHTFTVELATTPAERETGLMNRAELAANRGMLFVFESPQLVTFWMKNTLIPLDILYFDAEKKLTQIYADTPPCERDPCPTYASDATDITYALELPSGTSKAIGARIGDVFRTSAQ